MMAALLLTAACSSYDDTTTNPEPTPDTPTDPMEQRLKESLENYQLHPDVQANLQQLQYDLQQWNLALTTMTNINKNMGDALNSIASNFR